MPKVFFCDRCHARMNDPDKLFGHFQQEFLAETAGLPILCDDCEAALKELIEKFVASKPVVEEEKKGFTFFKKKKN